MKITLTNLLFVIALIGVSLAWWVDRNALVQQYQTEELRRAASFRVLSEARMTSFYFPHDEEYKMYDILDGYDLDPIGLDHAAEAYKILAIHDCYDKIDDKQFADRFVELALMVNKWETSNDLLLAIEKQQKLADKLRDTGESDEHKLSEFINRVATHESR